MATTFISNGLDTGGTDPTKSVQYIHDNLASAGDTINIPNGTFTWTTGVNLTKSITLAGNSTAPASQAAGTSSSIVKRPSGTSHTLVALDPTTDVNMTV